MPCNPIYGTIALPKYFPNARVIPHMLCSSIVRTSSGSSYTCTDIRLLYPQLEEIGDENYDATFRLLRDLKYLAEVEISHWPFSEAVANEPWLNRGIDSLKKVLLASSADDKDKIIKVLYFCQQGDVSRVSTLRLEKAESDAGCDCQCCTVKS